MRLIRDRPNYWSCSEFAHKVLMKFNIDKPNSADLETWRKWETASSQTNQLIYWLVEEQFDNIQNIIYFPYDVWNTVRIYVRNRFIDKTHLVNTKLKPGRWYDKDEVLLCAMFELLVDFVELEKANMWFICYDNDEDVDLPFQFKHRWAKWWSHRNPSAGLKYLEWETMLTLETDPTEPTHQAKNAKEIIKIYNWWKNIRPTRKDPMELSGLSEWYNTHEPFVTLPTEEDNKFRNLLDLNNKIEQEQDQEDEDMLLRLLKIRKSLWT